MQDQQLSTCSRYIQLQAIADLLELQCPICHHIVIDEILLPCLHGLCSACYSDTISKTPLITIALDDLKYIPSPEHLSDHLNIVEIVDFQCPICRQAFLWWLPECSGLPSSCTTIMNFRAALYDWKYGKGTYRNLLLWRRNSSIAAVESSSASSSSYPSIGGGGAGGDTTTTTNTTNTKTSCHDDDDGLFDLDDIYEPPMEKRRQCELNALSISCPNVLCGKTLTAWDFHRHVHQCQNFSLSCPWQDCQLNFDLMVPEGGTRNKYQIRYEYAKALIKHLRNDCLHEVRCPLKNCHHTFRWKNERQHLKDVHEATLNLQVEALKIVGRMLSARELDSMQSAIDDILVRFSEEHALPPLTTIDTRRLHENVLHQMMIPLPPTPPREHYLDLRVVVDDDD